MTKTYSPIKTVESPFTVEVTFADLEGFIALVEQSMWTRQEKDVAVMNIRGFYSTLRNKAKVSI